MTMMEKLIEIIRNWDGRHIAVYEQQRKAVLLASGEPEKVAQEVLEFYGEDFKIDAIEITETDVIVEFY